MVRGRYLVLLALLLALGLAWYAVRVTDAPMPGTAPSDASPAPMAGRRPGLSGSLPGASAAEEGPGDRELRATDESEDADLVARGPVGGPRHPPAIEVEVVDPEGHVVEGVALTVNPRGEGGHRPMGRATGAQGRARLVLNFNPTPERSVVDLYAVPSKADAETRRTAAARVEVTVHPLPSRPVRIELPWARRMAVRTLGPDGAPRPNAGFMWSQASGGNGHVRSDGEGRAVLDGLNPDESVTLHPEQLRRWSPLQGTARRQEEGQVSVPAGTPEAVVRFPSAHTLQLRAEGAPAGHKVTYRFVHPFASGTLELTSGGPAQPFWDIPNGTTLRIYTVGKDIWAGEIRDIVPRKEPWVLQLRRGAVLTGEIRGPLRDAAYGSEVFLENGTQRMKTTVNADYEFRFVGLLDGPHFIRLLDDDGVEGFAFASAVTQRPGHVVLVPEPGLPLDVEVVLEEPVAGETDLRYLLQVEYAKPGHRSQDQFGTISAGERSGTLRLRGRGPGAQAVEVSAVMNGKPLRGRASLTPDMQRVRVELKRVAEAGDRPAGR